MSARLDELVELALEDSLDPASAAELDALLADPSVHAKAMALLAIESALQAQRAVPADLAERVLDRVRSHRTSRMVRAVMTRVGRKRPAARRTWVAPVLAAACLVAVLGGVLVGVLSRSPTSSILVTATTGLVQVGVTGAWRDATIGEHLPAGTQVRCSPQATVALQWPDGTQIQLGEGTRGVVGGPGQARLRLDAGQADVAATHHEQHQIDVATDQAECLVVGTRFHVQAEPAITRLSVSDGVVRLRSRLDGSEQLVAAGSAAQVGTNSGAPHVSGFALADAGDGVAFRGLRDGDRLSMAELRQRPLTVIALTSPAAVGSVRMQLIPPAGVARPPANWEEYPPFTLRGDNKEDRLPGPAQCKRWLPTPGRYRIEAQASLAGRGKPGLGDTTVITIEITEP